MSNEKQITLSLSVEEVNLVLAGLAELPAKVSMNLISKVGNQAQGQLQQSPAVEEVANG